MHRLRMLWNSKAVLGDDVVLERVQMDPIALEVSSQRISESSKSSNAHSVGWTSK